MNAGRWVRLGLGLAFCALIGGSLSAVDRLKREDAGAERLYYPSGRFLREAAVGFRGMMADYFWFQTVQYYGGYRTGDHDLRYFEGLLDAVVQLDPRFVEGYYFGSLVYAMDFGDADKGIDLLKRGILANPDNYILHFNVGFTYYVLMRDYARAGCWFDAAAACPDATDFVARFAAFAKKKAGDLKASRALWINLLRTTSNPVMQDLAEKMIREIEETLAAQQPESGIY